MKTLNEYLINNHVKPEEARVQIPWADAHKICKEGEYYTLITKQGSKRIIHFVKTDGWDERDEECILEYSEILLINKPSNNTTYHNEMGIWTATTISTKLYYATQDEINQLKDQK